MANEWRAWGLALMGWAVVLGAAGQCSQASAAHLAPLARFTPEYPNLVYNASFEIPDWFDAQSCQFWQPRAFAICDASVSHSGRASLKFSGPCGGYTFQELDLVPATEYELSAWVKSQSASKGAVVIKYIQLRPSGMELAALPAPAAVESSKWVRLHGRFKAPADHRTGWVRLDAALSKGQAVWVDDLELKPVAGQVAAAPAPSIVPPGGVLPGEQIVQMKSALPDGVIRYTIDGSDPHAFSTQYTGPFWLAGSATVRARVFHGGYKPSAVTAARFELRPVLGPGVPIAPVHYGQDVQQWWAGHPYNPKSLEAFTGEVQSPQPRIDVAKVRDEHPDSLTGGIEEALSMLPREGGTLWLPKARGPYVIRKPLQRAQSYYKFRASVLVLRRSNIHFLSDGAVIRSEVPGEEAEPGHPSEVLAFCSMEYADHGRLQHPSRNFYFHDLVFDGGGTSAAALRFTHCCDVLIDDCTFRNFKNFASGLLNVTSKSDNVWARRCTFEGASPFAVYFDGVHNGGLVDCTFGPGLTQGGFLGFTNNDMAPYSASQRTCQYVVISGCTFAGPGREAVLITGANSLIVANQLEGSFGTFVHQQGRGQSNVLPYLRYRGSGIKVIDNRLRQVRTLALFSGDVIQNDAFAPQITEVRGNHAESAEALAAFDPVSPDAALFNRDSRIAGVEVRDNEVAGASLPQIRINATAADRLSDVHIEHNIFRGPGGHLLADLKGRPVQDAALDLHDNRIESRLLVPSGRR